MTFSDITIVPVQTEKRAAYDEFSARIAANYREYGALRVVDWWQVEDASDEDFHAADAMETYAPGELPNLRKLAGAHQGETVIVSFTEWPSREVCDRAVKEVAIDPRIQNTIHEEPLFDGRRLIAGGFEITAESR